MQILSTIAEMQKLVRSFRGAGRRIGFVPTMGFLHDGHLSLMQEARRENEVLIVSIFVNPTQFGPAEDLDRYPRDAEGDRKKCESAGVDVLFMPTAREMYPETPSVFVTVEGVSEVLEGAIRPGHFRGVATIVAKLFHIVMPDTAYFGQKDFQQCVVIRRMVAGLNMDVAVRVLPTTREHDGLAMSSRNSYLAPDERRKAPVLFRALSAARGWFLAGEADANRLKDLIQRTIAAEAGVNVDYVEITDPDNLQPVEQAGPGSVILLAARLGRTRLIDNLLL